METGRFLGKVAMVTGAGSGIGRATAVAFGAEGAKVIVADVDAKSGEETAGVIREVGGEASFCRTDVTQAGEVEECVRYAVTKYGALHCALNNAGISIGTEPLHEYPEELWDKIMAVNLKGVFLCMKYEIRQMLAQGGGAIVNTSSIAGLIGLRGHVAYPVSKHGVLGLTKTAAKNYAKAGIRINAVCPGTTMTPLIERRAQQIEGHVEREVSRSPAGRLGLPEEMAAAVLWLCSNEASFVNGVALPIDGGRVA